MTEAVIIPSRRWCYICQDYFPKKPDHDLMHCQEGRHCTAQAPECAVDTGPGRDHEKPFRCCTCKEIVT